MVMPIGGEPMMPLSPKEQGSIKNIRFYLDYLVPAVERGDLSASATYILNLLSLMNGSGPIPKEKIEAAKRELVAADEIIHQQGLDGQFGICSAEALQCVKNARDILLTS